MRRCITGLGGLDGQGQAAVLQGLFGLLKQTSGSVTLGGKPVALRGPNDAKSPEIGIALVPEDRKTEALILQQSIAANMELAALGRRDIDAGDPGLYTPFTDALELKCASLEQPVAQLSGGNQQKVALTK